MYGVSVVWSAVAKPREGGVPAGLAPLDSINHCASSDQQWSDRQCRRSENATGFIADLLGLAKTEARI